jgi:hypothetical protein
MRVVLSAALLAAMISDSAIGATMQLNCVPADPPSSERAALKVDIENQWMTLGDSTYDIVHMNDRYITAISRRKSESQVGAEVLVLNRITGDLKSASVYVPLIWHTSGESIISTFAAQCSR